MTDRIPDDDATPHGFWAWALAWLVALLWCKGVAARRAARAGEP